MVLVLAIGDLHIPDRSSDLPKAFKKLMIPGRIQQILCTGNLNSSETYQYLKSVCNEVHVVQGEYDTVGAWPTSKIITHGNYKIGLIHGHQFTPWAHPDTLESKAQQMDVDILIFGHTHQLQVYDKNNRFFINPGTGTGAFSSLGGSIEPIPSFILLDLQDSLVTSYIYKLKDGEVQVEVMEFKKE
ncbi:Metallo-dependent phosphatase [Neoconidiobolus thromboides FSU 785]|nr:Metallo-dependent phosphatase [Neoconidiobolus thromboides FSU 785]